MIKHSATLAINEKLNARRAAGQRVLHLGFGEAGLPVLPEVADALAEGVGANAYGPVAGSPEVRRATAGYFGRRGLATEEDQVVLAPGSKALLYAALAVLPGDLVLPRPSWVSYAVQARLVGKRVVTVPIPEEAGGIPDPDRLEHALTRARANGLDPRILLVTLPDNPTGTAPGAELVKRLCEVADHHGLFVISDEIYRDLAYQPAGHLGPATLLPERTLVTGGLSKNMALGGWRIGFARTPAGASGRELADQVIGVASEVWSSLAAPMQRAATYVLDEPRPVLAHIGASRRLHAAVALAVAREFQRAGATCRTPTAAFYCYPDLEPLRDRLLARGLTSGAEVAEFLLERHGIGVLAGEHFGDDPDSFRFRVATSLLYGETAEQRWLALRAEDPLALPWVAESLTLLRAGLSELRRPLDETSVASA